MKSLKILLLTLGLTMGQALCQTEDPEYLNPDRFLPSPVAQPKPAPRPVAPRPGVPALPTSPSAPPIAAEVDEPGQQPAHTAAPIAEAVPAELVEQDQTRVAVLCYHNFSQTKPVTDMRIRTSVFRQQMEQIRNAGITVISMDDFLDWKTGSKKLPAECILITIDDGWKGTYTDAYPILREMGFPFTIFIYTDFITGYGDAMSHDMIREMMAHGATVGSHSSKHLYPRVWKKLTQGTPAYAELVQQELGNSANTLRTLFQTPVLTYCYPGGYNTPEMVEKAPSFNYKAAFTVVGKKTTHDSENYLIPRYVIEGGKPYTFQRALNFKQAGGNDAPGSATGSANLPPPPFPVVPAANQVSTVNIPIISADLSSIPGLLPQLSNFDMKVSGFGRVPFEFDAQKKLLFWKPDRRIYNSDITVQIQWKTAGGTMPHTARWSFKISPEIPLN